MTFLATTRVSILRGETQNTVGDPIDDNRFPDAVVPGLGDLPASLIEKSRKVYDFASQEQRTVRWVVGRLTPGTDIRDGDRVRDNRTGTIYALDEITRKPRSISGQSDLILDLRVLVTT